MSTELRLETRRMAKAFYDGRRKYIRDWLTDRNVASLAWSLAEERQRRGFGGLAAIHIKPHAKDCKHSSQFTPHHHEAMYVRADELTHTITPRVPM